MASSIPAEEERLSCLETVFIRLQGKLTCLLNSFYLNVLEKGESKNNLIQLLARKGITFYPTDSTHHLNYHSLGSYNILP